MMRKVLRFAPCLAAALVPGAGCAGAHDDGKSTESGAGLEPLPHVWLAEGRETALDAAGRGYQPVAAVREAFAEFDMERIERHWQGVWLFPGTEVWQVEGSRITVYYPGHEPSSELFEVNSPCSVARVMLDVEGGSYAGYGQITIAYAVRGDRTFVGGARGFVTELADGTTALAACHSGATTTLIGDRCTHWTSRRNTRGERQLSGEERPCGLEPDESAGGASGRFHYEDGDFRTRTIMLVEGLVLLDPARPPMEILRYDSLDEALAALAAGSGA
jgi:hypothetical protein